jgi:hypothetical protein
VEELGGVGLVGDWTRFPTLDAKTPRTLLGVARRLGGDGSLTASGRVVEIYTDPSARRLVHGSCEKVYSLSLGERVRVRALTRRDAYLVVVFFVVFE